MTTIDVVIPSFNAERTIAETLDSVRRQTRPPDTIIVVDDGSTDTTAATAAACGARVIRQSNAGPASAMNTGVGASEADLVAFLDADDLWCDSKLQLQASLLGAAGQPPDAALGLYECFICPALDAETASRFRLPPVGPAWLSGALLVRRAVLDTVGPFDIGLRVGHMIDWFDRARRQGVSFAIPNEIVLRRRLHPASLSQRSPQRDDGMIQAVRLALERRRMRGRS